MAKNCQTVLRPEDDFTTGMQTQGVLPIFLFPRSIYNGCVVVLGKRLMLRSIKYIRAVFVVAILGLVASFVAVSPASAVPPNPVVPSSGLQFSNTIDIGSNAVPGFTQRYGNIVTIGGVSFDGIVTVLGTNGGRFNVLDYTKSGSTAPINTQMSAPTTGGSVSYQVAFVYHGTDDPVTLRDIYVNVTDIDSRQWAQFSGVQQYSLSSSPATKLVVQTNATNSSIPVGAYRFAETNNISSNDADQDFWAQVKYDQASSIIVTLAKGAGTAGSAVFGVSFIQATWTNTPSTTVITPSVYTLSYDANGGTGGSVPNSATTSGAQNTVSVVGNTGSLTKPGYVFDGWNTLPEGNGVTWEPNAVMTPTADTTLYAMWKPNFPQMQVTKVQYSIDPTYPSVSSNQVLYEVTVKNVGNVPLTNVTMQDPGSTFVSCAGSPTWPIASLAVGVSVTCTYSITATSTADIVNTAYATSDQLGTVNSNTVTTKVNGTNDMQVSKIQTSTNPEQAGEVVTFDVILHNVGSLTQTNVVLTDPNATFTSSDCDNPMPATVATGGHITCHVIHVVTQDEIDAGVYTNTAQATSTFFTTPVLSNTVTVRFLQFSALDLEKAQNSETPSQIGDVILYDILATNRGNTELTNLTVTDPGADAGSVNCGVNLPTTLAPGEQLSCTANHTVTKADFKAKSFTNIAYASTSQLGEQASNAVTTDLSALADTGGPTTHVEIVTIFAVIAGLSGVLLLILRRRVKM